MSRTFSPIRSTARGLTLLVVGLFYASVTHAQQSDRNPLVHKVETATDRLEMVVNSSRILTLDQKVPRAQVNNPEIMTLTPLSPNQIQISAKKAGVTEVNLWTINPETKAEEIRSVDVIVYGDSRELNMLIKTQFPSATITAIPTANSIILKGFVDRADHVNQIIRMAEDYYPKVISNITVGGVQQILLHVQVMEVSRTKLRQMGFDFSNLNGSNFVVSSVSGVISAATNGASAAGTGTDTVRFGVIDGKNSFFGFMNALRQNDLAKVLAEPNLVTVSGRPAFFNSGGEIPIVVPGSLGQSTIEWKKYGTQVDFVPIVLGNGNIRLEVRPRVSEIDDSRSVTINGISVPALRVREVDTGVEMQAGQTLAIAGLVQDRIEASNAGLPFLSDIPYFGMPFRRVKEKKNEIELVVIVTPELVSAVDASDAPRIAPGLQTTNPNDCELYFKGHLEVPTCNLPGAPAPQSGRIYEEVPQGKNPITPASTSNGGRTASTPSRGPVSKAGYTPPATSPQSSQRYNPAKPTTSPGTNAAKSEGGFIGPLGYDVNNK